MSAEGKWRRANDGDDVEVVPTGAGRTARRKAAGILDRRSQVSKKRMALDDEGKWRRNLMIFDYVDVGRTSANVLKELIRTWRW